MARGVITRYILPLDLELKWIEAIRAYPCEWVAGLKLVGEVIGWFGFTVGDEYRVRFIDVRVVDRPLGTVHYHPYDHSETPVPSLSDGLNWVYLSYWEIPDDLNPLFFIAFRDGYASWAMFPKPPIVRRRWLEEFDRIRREEEASWNLCLKLLKENLIKTGCISLAEKPVEFQTF